jgi:AcrR family transcriptional regulator
MMHRTQRRTRTRLDPEVRREQIIEAAEQVFLGRDPSEVTFEQIAEAAGVSRALVYNYFGDKGGLIAAVYLRSFQRLDEHLNRAIDAAPRPEDRLRAIVVTYLTFARSNAGAWKLINSAEATFHPIVQQARRRRYERMAMTWGGTPEARLLARAIVGFLEAATLDWLDATQPDVDTATDLLHAVLWSGLSGPATFELLGHPLRAHVTMSG